MKWFLALTLHLVVFLCPLLALEPTSDPTLAMVRIKSHGGSGTIIATQTGKSWILSCAHMFLDDNNQPSEEARKRPLKIDGPAQPHATPQRAQARLLHWDYDLDLSLIEIDNGPFNFVPIASKNHQPSKNILSCGYDDMKWPITTDRITILFSEGNTTFTKQKPWHGRSGGGLIDLDYKVLIGVVQGYEVGPGGRGMYVSLQAIITFMANRRQPQATPKLPYTNPPC